MSLETDAGKATVGLLCKTFDLSRAAYYEARKADGKIISIASRRSVPQQDGKPARVSAVALEAAIRRLCEEHRAWGVRKIWAMLRREGTKVSRRRVWAVMKALGLTLPPDRERGDEPRRGQVATPEPDRRIATDLTTVFTKEDGLVAIVPVIDCGSRFMMALAATKSQSSPAVLAPVRQALEARYGSPAGIPLDLELRTDHGPQYTGSDCEKLCKRWNLDHTLAPVGRPTGNAVCERVIRTMKEELIWLRDWTSLAELQAALDDWRHFYNTRRPHQALGDLTPEEWLHAKLGGKRKAAAA